MHWLLSPAETAPSLPAVWLIATPQRPDGLTERNLLRRETARAVLARRFGLPETAVAIGHDGAGRPVILAPAGTGLHLSLATRDGVVAVALASEPAGVDVERVDAATEPPVALLHPDERLTLAGLRMPDRPAAFARLWAAKEACVKALGTGFATPPESFAVAIDRDGGLRVAGLPSGMRAHGVVRMTKGGGEETLAAALVMLSERG